MNTLKTLKTQNVQQSADKTLPFLRRELEKYANNRLVVVFLGEAHQNAVDRQVTTSVLVDPPLEGRQGTGLVWEAGLKNRYPNVSNRFTWCREERDNQGQGPVVRNSVIGELVLQGLSHSDVLYVACGADHAEPVFGYITKKIQNLTFLLKPSAEPG